MSSEMTDVMPTRREVDETMHAPVLQKAWDVMEKAPKQTYYFATLGSILFSLALFLRGKRDAGIFVGLWRPTIISLALVNRLLKPSKGT